MKTPQPAARQSHQRHVDSPRQVVSQEDMRRAHLRSGYLLEHRIETVLRRKGWLVEASKAYRDNETGKSREFDLSALQPWKIGSQKQPKTKKDFVWAHLLIECVNNPQPLAFLTKLRPYTPYGIEEIVFVCDPAIVSTKTGKHDIREFLDMSSYHHYCRGRVATQFCSFVMKRDKREWMATHEQEHFDTFATLTKVVDDCVDGFKYSRGTYLNATLICPVLVIQGALLDVRHDKGQLVFRTQDHLRYRRSVATGKQGRDYVIDVVTERGFPRYLLMLEEEARKTAFRMHRVRDFLRKNIRLLPRPKSPLPLKK
jgi:hypothetical protein